MREFSKSSASLFIQTCQYLKGREVNVKKRNGSPVRGVVVGLGAFSWRPHSNVSKIALWANVKESKTGKMLKVDLFKLYKSYPAGGRKKKAQPAIAEGSDSPS